jgi:uncharacterized protein (TIGR02996 family)
VNEQLRRICAEPTNLQLRQVYADTLAEAGDPRGAFIACQVALSRLDPLEPQYARTLATAQRLEVQHRAAWLEPLVARVGRPLRSLQPVFTNGFLHRVALEPEELLPTWEWLTHEQPVDGVELLVGEHLPSPARQLPAGLRVLKVSPEGWFAPNSVGNVLAAGVASVRELDLSGCDVGTTGARLLANLKTDLAETFDDFREPAPFATGQLQRLVLHGCGVGDAGVQLLVGAAHLEGLVALDLGQCKLTDAATLVALREARVLASLTELSLAGNNKLAGHFGGLAGWSVLPRLRSLALPQSLTESELRALFPQPSPALRLLDLRSNKGLLKTPRAVLQVADALTSLDVGTTSLGDAGWRTLLEASPLRRVLHLSANGCSLSDDAVEALVGSSLDRLLSLDLSSNKLTDRALTLLAAWPGLASVTSLRVSNNRKLTAAGYQALIDAEHFMPASLDLGALNAPKLVGALRERFGAALELAD